ncbi:hypothetical protein BGZ88_002799 [Linnemannia elongata]|nr:hypothetical protein BGZ88_002799 [Linnemannia elongata]
MDWFCKAAEQDDPAGHFNVARMYDYALRVPMDHLSAMSGYLKASAKGYAFVQYAIGALTQSDAKAMSQAEIQIGVMYRGGRGVLVDDSIALEWFNIAIEHGDSDGWGAYTKEYIHYCGLGVIKDNVTAMKWFIKAAQHDIPRAHFGVGELYYFGKGVPKDHQKAMTCFMIAAGQGHTNAQYRVGSMYFKGDGVSLDNSKAIGWLHKAVEQGHRLAQFDLGWVYYTGKGVAKNPRVAKSWLRKAVKQGHEGAKSHLQQIEREE